jgi:hypothetical protein
MYAKRGDTLPRRSYTSFRSYRTEQHAHNTGADRFTRMTQLHEMLNLDTLETRIKQLALKTIDTYTNHENTQQQTTLQEAHTTNRFNTKHQT